MTDTVEDGDEVTVAYAADTTNAVQLEDRHGDGTDIAAISATSVTNNSGKDLTAATVDFGSSTTAVASDGGSVVLKFNEQLADITDDANTRAQFTVLVNGSSNSVSGIALGGSNSEVTLTLTDTVEDGDEVTVAYAADTTNAVQLEDRH